MSGSFCPKCVKLALPLLPNANPIPSVLQYVFTPSGSSPAGLVSPPVHAVHTLLATLKFSSHKHFCGFSILQHGVVICKTPPSSYGEIHVLGSPTLLVQSNVAVHAPASAAPLTTSSCQIAPSFFTHISLI